MKKHVLGPFIKDNLLGTKNNSRFDDNISHQIFFKPEYFFLDYSLSNME